MKSLLEKSIHDAPVLPPFLQKFLPGIFKTAPKP
jgi:hypothetical protein